MEQNQYQCTYDTWEKIQNYNSCLLLPSQPFYSKIIYMKSGVLENTSTRHKLSATYLTLCVPFWSLPLFRWSAQLSFEDR